MAIRNLLLAVPLAFSFVTTLFAQAAPPPTAAEAPAQASTAPASDVPQMQLAAPEEHVVAPPPVRSPQPAPAASALPQYFQAPAPACELHASPSPCTQSATAYRHDGFYLRAALQAQYLAFAGHGPDGSTSVKGLGTGSLLAVGGTPLPGLVIAGLLSSDAVRGKFKGRPAQAQEDNASMSRAMLGVLVDWFPLPDDGWHVGATVGFAAISLTDSAVPTAAGAAFSAKLFGGYDWWIGPQWSLGVAALLAATPSVALRNRDGDDTGYRFYTLSAGVAWSLTLH